MERELEETGRGLQGEEGGWRKLWRCWKIEKRNGRRRDWRGVCRAKQLSVSGPA